MKLQIFMLQLYFKIKFSFMKCLTTRKNQDFEMAHINVIQRVLPGTVIGSCLFKWCQNVVKHAASLGLKTRTNEDLNIKNSVLMLQARRTIRKP